MSERHRLAGGFPLDGEGASLTESRSLFCLAGVALISPRDNLRTIELEGCGARLADVHGGTAANRVCIGGVAYDSSLV